MKINYRKFIEENFDVVSKETLTPIPFKFNVVQDKYYEMIQEDYDNLKGVREIVLKARQEGMSSFILALFTVDFLLRPYSTSICISHRKDATDLLFKKVKGYLESYFVKLAEKYKSTPEEIQKQFMKSDNRNLIENASNHSTFYISTAGAKVGGRGTTCNNVLFSETAFFQDTDIVTAQEIVVATAQQVPQGQGMIFIESTGNGEGNYYHSEWERANQFDEDGQRVSVYHPRFFGWQEFYTEEWVKEKRKDFPNDMMHKQEYPANAEEAFVTSGTPFFDTLILQKMMKESPDAITQGRFAADGSWL